MKNYLKIFGVITLAVIIGFSFFACGDDDSGGGGTGSGNDNGGGGNNPSVNITWTTLTASQLPYIYTGGFISSVVYGSGMFIAIEADENIYSSDGVTWQKLPGLTSFRYHSVSYCNDIFFIGTSRGQLFYATDGIEQEEDWEQLNLSSIFGAGTNDNINYISAITYGAGKYVAVGQNGKIACSDDGISWTEATGVSITTAIHSVTFGGGKFIAVGADGKIVSSADGETWTEITTASFLNQHNIPATMRSVTYGGGKFVAVGNIFIWHSTDGETWTKGTSTLFDEGNIPEIRNVIYDGSKFIAVGRYGRIAWSADGNTWTDISSDNLDFYGIAFGANRFVAGGQSKRIIYSNTQ